MELTPDQKTAIQHAAVEGFGFRTLCNVRNAIMAGTTTLTIEDLTDIAVLLSIKGANWWDNRFVQILKHTSMGDLSDMAFDYLTTTTGALKAARAIW